MDIHNQQTIHLIQTLLNYGSFLLYVFSKIVFCQMERFPLLHPDLTHAHIYTHRDTHMQFTCHIHHTPTQMHSDILTHPHTHTPLYHMRHTPVHMHSYTLIDTHTHNTHPHTHTIRFIYPLRCTHTLIHQTYHVRHTLARIQSYAHMHTHTLHTTHTICGSGGPDHQHF